MEGLSVHEDRPSGRHAGQGRRAASARGISNTRTENAGSVLNVPVRKPVKLLITSADVVHSLYIPAYRIKEDAVPGRQTYLWFLPDERGSYDLFCTEYCGVAHSSMTTKVNVMTEQDFNDWYQGGKRSMPGKQIPEKAKAAAPRSGENLVQTKGCLACHSPDGTPKVGPGSKRFSGKKRL